MCEKFVACDDLDRDMLVEDLLFEFRKEFQAGDRDRIEYCSDGSYSLLKTKVRKQRNQKKKRAAEASQSAPAAKKPANAEPEIIMLDDD